jgi:hypothetical protein
MLLKVNIPTEAGNAAIRDGRLGEVMESALQELQPEAAYFTLENGMRTALLFVDLADPSQMPPTGERFFMEMGASIDMTPAMNAEELRRGLSELRAAMPAGG